MMNVYNGNATTDASGLAVIEMPAWFNALNRDFRYQLTTINSFAHVTVVNELKNNKFTIQSSEPKTKVSWQITGIRKDEFANLNRIPTEVLKEDHNRGKYLHPQAWAKKKGVTELPQILSIEKPTSQNVNEMISESKTTTKK